jgi:Fic family protein
MSNQSNAVGFQWHPIEDLPADWQSLANPELASLATIWAEQHTQLKSSQSVKEFNERLLREWSIETGIIERLYTIDRGVTQLLIEQGIDAALIPHGATDKPAAEVVRILEDHRGALEGIFEFVSRRQPLTISYIRQLHQIITRSQDFVEAVDQFGKVTHRELIKGDWKRWPNNPTRPDGRIHEYCPPIHVAAEMDRLLELHRQHEALGASPEISAAWLHHRFVQIHPFEDGNGRVARALATIVFLQAKWFPLVVNRDQRGEYIAALEAADDGDLGRLILLFATIAKRSFAKALELSEDVLQGRAALPEIISGISDIYQARHRSAEQAYQRVEGVAEQLAEQAYLTLKEVAEQTRARFAGPGIERPPHFWVKRSDEASKHYYARQIVQTAKDFPPESTYWANVVRQRLWARLTIVDRFSNQKAHMVFSFHYLGKINRGVMVCTGFIDFPESDSSYPERDVEEQDDARFSETHRICNEPFYFSYRDENRLDALKNDFLIWLKDAVAVGLAEWVQRL